MVIKNIGYLYLIQLLRLVLPLTLLSLLTKILSASQYSVYVYTLASAAWLSTFVEYGFNVSATRRIASAAGPDSTCLVVVQTQSAKWLLTGLTLPFLIWATLASAVYSSYPEWAVGAWLLGVLTGLTPTYYYQAMSKLSIVALLEACGGVFTFVSVLLLVRAPEDFWRLCLIMVVVRLVIWQGMDRQLLADTRLRRREFLAATSGLTALRNGWKIFLVQVAASFYTSFNVVLLGGVSTSYAVAVYGSSERLIRAGVAFIGQATSAIFPRLNALKVSDRMRLARTRRLTLLTFMAGSVVCLPVIWGLAPLVSEILFHSQLPDLPKVLRIMALVVPAIAISNVLAIHFFVVDHQEHIVNAVVFSAVPVSLIAGAILSYKYGAIGMATAWVAVEWLVSFALAIILYRRNKSAQQSQRLVA